MAAQTMLHSSCKKRKDILPKAVQFIVGVITSNDATPSQKDGALHMVMQYLYFVHYKIILNCIIICFLSLDHWLMSYLKKICIRIKWVICYINMCSQFFKVHMGI